MMKQIELSKQGRNKGKFVAFVDDEDYEYLSQFRWSVQKQGNRFYAVSKVKMHKKDVRIMHRIIMNAPENNIVDHIDHNGLNNQKHNLRICTCSLNTKNRSKSINKTSRYKGVSFHKRHNNWISQITLNYELIYIGTFQTEKEAAVAYDKKAIELHGEFANLNFK